MKTVKEMYREIENSKQLQQELKEATKEKLEEFLMKHDRDASGNDFCEYVRSQQEGEIDDDDAETAAGGWSPAWASGTWNMGNPKAK